MSGSDELNHQSSLIFPVRGCGTSVRDGFALLRGVCSVDTRHACCPQRSGKRDLTPGRCLLCSVLPWQKDGEAGAGRAAAEWGRKSGGALYIKLSRPYILRPQGAAAGQPPATLNNLFMQRPRRGCHNLQISGLCLQAPCAPWPLGLNSDYQLTNYRMTDNNYRLVQKKERYCFAKEQLGTDRQDFLATWPKLLCSGNYMLPRQVQPRSNITAPPPPLCMGVLCSCIVCMHCVH